MILILTSYFPFVLNFHTTSLPIFVLENIVHVHVCLNLSVSTRVVCW
jgi:hypothetical protein